MRVWVGAALAVMATASQAEEWPFRCVPVNELAEMTSGTDEVRLNNFAIRERESFSTKKLSVLEVAFSVANRRSGKVHLKGQFLALGADNLPVAVMTASLPFDVVQGSTTETLKGDVFVAPGTMATINEVCVHVVGDF